MHCGIAGSKAEFIIYCPYKSLEDIYLSNSAKENC